MVGHFYYHFTRPVKTEILHRRTARAAVKTTQSAGRGQRAPHNVQVFTVLLARGVERAPLPPGRAAAKRRVLGPAGVTQIWVAPARSFRP